MTAGAGLLHEERHEKEFAKGGGVLELVQLWVNVPKKDKMAAPHYQELLAATIPAVTPAGGNSRVRVIAGTYEGVQGPAKTFSPMTLLDVKLPRGESVALHLPADYNTGLYVLKGAVTVNGRTAGTKQLVVFGWNSDLIEIRSEEEAVFLVLSGAPIEEPLATYGPFVMNTNKELVQAMDDYAAGKMGTLKD